MDSTAGGRTFLGSGDDSCEGFPVADATRPHFSSCSFLKAGLRPFWPVCSEIIVQRGVFEPAADIDALMLQARFLTLNSQPIRTPSITLLAEKTLVVRL